MDPQLLCNRWADKLTLRIDVLSAEDQIALQEHLEICPECTTLHGQYQRITEDLQHLTAALDIPDMLPSILKAKEQHMLEAKESAVRKSVFLRTIQYFWSNSLARRVGAKWKHLFNLFIQIVVHLSFSSLLAAEGTNTPSRRENIKSTGDNFVQSPCEQHEDTSGRESALLSQIILPDKDKHLSTEVNTGELFHLDEVCMPKSIQQQHPPLVIGENLRFFPSKKQHIEFQIRVLCPHRFTEVLYSDPESTILAVKKCVERILPEILGKIDVEVVLNSKDQEGSIEHQSENKKEYLPLSHREDLERDRNEELFAPTQKRPVRVVATMI